MQAGYPHKDLSGVLEPEGPSAYLITGAKRDTGGNQAGSGDLSLWEHLPRSLPVGHDGPAPLKHPGSHRAQPRVWGTSPQDRGGSPSHTATWVL